MGKYRVTGTVEFEITVELEADTASDASDAFDMICWGVDACEEGPVVTNADEGSNSVDTVESLNEEKWQAMEASEKVAFLEGQGVDGVEAAEMVADEESHAGELEDYINQLEV